MANFFSYNNTFYNLDFIREIEFIENKLNWQIRLQWFDGKENTLSFADEDQRNLYLDIFERLGKQWSERDHS